MFRSGKKHIVPLIVHGLPLTGPDTGQLQALKKDNDQLQKEIKAMKEQCHSLEHSVSAVSTSWSLKCRRVPFAPPSCMCVLSKGGLSFHHV
jgi:hypothetical protein